MRCNRDVAPQIRCNHLVLVVAHAAAVFGDEHKASHWFATPSPFFDGRAPSELIETDDGIALVEQTLSRIDGRRDECM